MFALNISDLSAPGFEIACAFMLRDVRGPIVRANSSVIDGDAMVLDCDDARASAIVDVLRARGRLRAYRKGPRGGWVEVRASS